MTCRKDEKNFTEKCTPWKSTTWNTKDLQKNRRATSTTFFMREDTIVRSICAMPNGVTPVWCRKRFLIISTPLLFTVRSGAPLLLNWRNEKREISPPILEG